MEGAAGAEAGWWVGAGAGRWWTGERLMPKGRKGPREAGGTIPLVSSPGGAFPWSSVLDILIPDATLVAEHDRTGREGDRPAGNEKGMLDHCIGALRRAWGLVTVRT